MTSTDLEVVTVTMFGTAAVLVELNENSESLKMMSFLLITGLPGSSMTVTNKTQLLNLLIPLLSL